MIEGIIFDFDDTIIDDAESTVEEILSILRQCDLRFDEITVKNYILTATSDYSICRKFLVGYEIEFAYEKIKAVNLQKMQKVELSDTMANTLRDLSKYFQLFIISGRDTASLKYSLERLKIDHLFKQIIGSDPLIESKPNPITLLELAGRNNLNLKNCIYIGDSQTDYEFSKHAKCGFIGAAWFRNGLKDIEETEEVCFDIVRLESHISRYLKRLHTN